MNRLSLIVLLFVQPLNYALGQTESWETMRLDCPNTRLSWLSSAPDSTLSPFALDSIGKSILGRWQLVRVSDGWSKPHQPEHPTEIQVSQNGKGRTYINGHRVNRFRITLSTRYGYIRCIIPEDGTRVFNVRRHHRGRLYVCSQTMIISQDLGDGEAFFFKRL